MRLGATDGGTSHRHLQLRFTSVGNSPPPTTIESWMDFEAPSPKCPIVAVREKHSLPAGFCREATEAAPCLLISLTSSINFSGHFVARDGLAMTSGLPPRKLMVSIRNSMRGPASDFFLSMICRSSLKLVKVLRAARTRGRGAIIPKSSK